MGIERTRFGDLLEIPLRNGLTRPKRVRGSGVLMVNMGELFAHDRIGNVAMERVPLSGADAPREMLREGDLLFARQSLVREGAGKVSIFLGADEPVTFESHIIRARIDRTKACPYYLFRLFQAPQGRVLIQSIVNQVSAAGIRGSDLTRLPVPLIPLSDQRSAASVLAALDDKVVSNRRVVSDCAALLELAYQSATRDAQPGTLGDLGTITGGGTPRSGVEVFWAPAEVPWITPSDMTALGGVPLVWQGSRAISRAGLSASSARLIPQGSVMFTSRATIGLVAIAQQELATNQGFINVIPHPRFSSPFVYSTLRERRDAIAAKANGSTFLEVNKTNFKAVTCRLPSDEQLAAHDAVALPALRSMAGLTLESQRLAAIRDALLPRLVSGRLRVPPTNTPDEAVETVLGAG